jgi:acetyl esterase/lipase
MHRILIPAFVLITASLFAQRPQPPNLDSVDVTRDIPYADNDNPRQRLDLYLPKSRSSEERLPVLVFIHGGGWRAGDKAAGAGNLMRFMGSGKYAGVSVGYRLTNEAQWPAQLHDCKAAIRWLRGNAEKHGLNADRIVVWGTSAGGHLVSMLGTSGDVEKLEGDLGSFDEESSAVTAVVNFFGPENFVTMVNQPSTINRETADYPEALLLGGRVQDRPEVAQEASPVTHISAGDAAFLTAHGTEDPLVPFAQATELHQKLQQAKVPSILVTMDGGGHGFMSPELDEIIARFLAKHLLGEEAELTDVQIKTTPRPKRKS